MPRAPEANTPWARILVLTLARLLINSGLRIVYPFLPQLARGVERPAADLSRLLALRGAMGVLGPVFGPWADARGRRAVLVWGAILFAAGCLLVSLSPTYLALGGMLVLVAVSKIVFDPALQGQVADDVDYDRRGVALAVTELSWAGALILGAPLAGWLIARGSWRIGLLEGPGWTAPFLALSVLGAAAVIAVALVVPGRPERIGRGAVASVSPLVALRLLRIPRVAAALAFVAFIMLANELVFVSYGGWLEGDHGVSAAGLGLSIALIGLAELVGEALVGRMVDRHGKRRVIVIMAGGAAVFMAAFAMIVGWPSAHAYAWGPTPGLIALGATFLCFEMAYVGSLPLMTELVPGARASVMSLVVAAMSGGRATGALIAPWLWRAPGGMAAVATAAAVAFAIGAWIVGRAVHEPPSSGWPEANGHSDTVVPSPQTEGGFR